MHNLSKIIFLKGIAKELKTKWSGSLRCRVKRETEESWSTYHLERSERLKESLSSYHLEQSEMLKESWSTFHLERSERLKEF